VQIGGGLLSLSHKAKTAKLGLHIVTGGLFFQQALILFFLTMTVRYTIKLKRNAMINSGGLRAPGRMVHVLQASLALITVSISTIPDVCFVDSPKYRIVFRLVEFCSSQGSSINTYINHHEFFVYVFDAVPMFFALVLMNIWHPGKALKQKIEEEVVYSALDLRTAPDFRMDRY
jgi:hypothetical protein